MTITNAKLMRVAGLCALLAGVVFLLPQFIHPEDEVASVTTTGWAVAHLVNMSMAILALIGVTGLYLRQVREAGVLGLLGYLLFGTGFLLIAIVSFAEAVILPKIADADPGYVSDFLATLVDDPVKGDVGGLSLANGIAGITYLLGGLVFGIALYRARIVARWAALLLAVGGVTPLFVAVLPDSMLRTATFPTAIAMIGLGYSLWREKRIVIPEPTPSVSSSQLNAAGV
jgi:hypothetical protein